jgi:hypothetical protein
VRHYQVNATVTLAGISLFSKKNVGGAVLTYQQSTCPDCTVSALQFAAGSWPERLKGFNRFGMTEEMVREESGTVAESAYVSFMSSSPEKNLSEARQAFASQEIVPLTIGIGHSSPKGCTAQLQHDKVSGDHDWRNCQEIIDQIRPAATLSQASEKAGSAVLPTFLFAVRQAITTNDGQPVRYMHNAKFYHLKTHVDGGPREGQIAVTGRISSESDRAETEFKVWVPADNPTSLPTRIQWKARSFLLLTLEADETVNPPALRFLLNQEQA